MLRKVKDSTIELLRDALINLNISGEIKESDVDEICEFFEKKEIEFSTRQTLGMNVDIEEFSKISSAVDDFFIEADSKDSIDLEDLNTRLSL